MKLEDSQSDSEGLGSGGKEATGANRLKLPGLSRDFLSTKVLNEKTALWPEDKTYRFQTYIDEAEFFFKIAKSQIEEYGVGSVVDVGSGIGLFGRLMSTLGVRVTCLEPASEGFSDVFEMAEIIDHAWTSRAVKFDFRKEALRDFVHLGVRGDFYTCINVIEHVPNYEDLLREIIIEVGDSGYAYIVFPNYSFPYEPHFSFVTLGSKVLTERFLLKSIAANRHHLQNPWGFWADLSWPTYRKTKRVLQSSGANYRFSRVTFLSYFSRLSDKRFLGRKGRGFRFLQRFKALGAWFGMLFPLPMIPVIDLRIGPRDKRFTRRSLNTTRIV